MNDVNSLSHSKWRCKYHIVFAPKYRRMAIYKQVKADIGKILRQLCDQKGIRIIEAECCPDHIHMLVEIPPHISVSYFMGYLIRARGVNSLTTTSLFLQSPTRGLFFCSFLLAVFTRKQVAEHLHL